MNNPLEATIVKALPVEDREGSNLYRNILLEMGFTCNVNNIFQYTGKEIPIKIEELEHGFYFNDIFIGCFAKVLHELLKYAEDNHIEIDNVFGYSVYIDSEGLDSIDRTEKYLDIINDPMTITDGLENLKNLIWSDRVLGFDEPIFII